MNYAELVVEVNIIIVLITFIDLQIIDLHIFSLVTNRFHVAVRLFFIRSQMTSNCGKNKEVAHEPQASVSQMFSPRFDFFCDPLLTSLMATWNLFGGGGAGGGG